MAAMTGFDAHRKASKCRHTGRWPSGRSRPGFAGPCSFKSAPAENARPPTPETIPTRTSGSLSIRSTASTSNVRISSFCAFSTSGRFSATYILRSRTSTTTGGVSLITHLAVGSGRG